MKTPDTYPNDAEELTRVVIDILAEVIECCEQGYPLYPHKAQNLVLQLGKVTNDDFDLSELRCYIKE